MVVDRDSWKKLAMDGAHVAATAANQTIRGAMATTKIEPLPPYATKEQVATALDRVRQRTQYASEPTPER